VAAGQGRFLIGVKNPLPIRPAATARQHGPLRDRAIRRIRNVGRATPSLHHKSGETFSSRLTRASHPDRRAAVYPYLLGGLAIERANQVWCSDVTYIPMAK
jgi:putative transposase